MDQLKGFQREGNWIAWSKGLVMEINFSILDFWGREVNGAQDFQQAQAIQWHSKLTKPQA